MRGTSFTRRQPQYREVVRTSLLEKGYILIPAEEGLSSVTRSKVQIALSCTMAPPRNSPLTRPAHSRMFSFCSVRLEGRIEIVTDVGRNAVDAKVPNDERQFRGRSSRVVLAPLGWCQVGDNACALRR